MNLGFWRGIKTVPSDFGSLIDYRTKIRNLFGSSVIAYWELAEAGGAIAVDFVNGRNGSYVGADAGVGSSQTGKLSPFFDGTNDYVNIYSAALASAFNGEIGSFLIKAKVSNISDWNDSTTREMVRILADGNNFLSIQKTTVQNNVQFRHRAAGQAAATVSTNITPLSSWISLAMTWDRAANEMKAFFNGAQLGTTQAMSGTWSGAPAAATTLLGSATQTPTAQWKGYLSDAILLNRVATISEISAFSGNY